MRERNQTRECSGWTDASYLSGQPVAWENRPQIPWIQESVGVGSKTVRDMKIAGGK